MTHDEELREDIRDADCVWSKKRGWIELPDGPRSRRYSKPGDFEDDSDEETNKE